MESIGERGTTIQEFYRGASVLITGGTGFMGKVLVEKLLRSCPHLSSVYLLVRSKKGKDAESRLDDLFNDPLFGNLQDQMPKFRHKVAAISGDCSMPGLGLIPSDRNLLTEEVSFVFHGAATVRFDEKLRIAMSTNVAGTENVLELVHDMKKLKAVIHISTAYCNCHLQEIQEKFYSYPLTYQKLSAFMDGVNDKMVDAITPHLLGEWPNTYAFTKAMAEDLVRDKGLGLPIGVFRPAIVVATRDEPVSGWIDNLYGPTGVVVGAATGLIKTLHGDAGVNADIVPVDMAVNAVIVSAWEVANKPRAHTADEIPLYNYVSSVQKPLTWGQFMDKVSRYGIHVPTVRTVWCYSFTLNKHRSLHLMYVLFLHFLPAFIIDGVTMLFGNKPKLVKIYKKINKFCSVLSYFGNREWKFTNNNIQGLWEKLHENDKKLFDFDINGLDWDNYFYKYVRGIRIYLMKDDLSTVPQGLARQKRLRWMHQAIKAVLLILVVRLLWAIWTIIL